MSTIKDVPYFEAQFDKDGKSTNSVSLPADTTDVFVMAHGWRNDAAEASKLYTDFFNNFFADPELVKSGSLAGRKCAIVGVFWPSKNFDGLIAAQGGGTPSNTASIGDVPSDAASQDKLVAQLEALKQSGIFDEPAQKEALSKAQALVPDLDDKETARAAFMEHLRSLMDRGAIDKEDASDIFFKNDPNDVLRKLNIPPNSVDRSIPRTGKAMALTPGEPVIATGHAAGLLDIFKGATAAGSNAVSYLSYFMMKQRAGAVGTNGVAPLIDKLAPAAALKRIHLIGHSFGGRVVAAAALSSKNEKIHSVSFLQAAFSHNGFSPAALMNGFFRQVIDKQRVKGPIIATHTKNDTAVGIAYPLASRISGTVAAALGDENDKYGGLGRNGAQKMNEGEVVKAELLAAGKAYQLKPGKFHNLLADAFVKNHGDVTSQEVASAVRAAAV
jgi:hypothetical protein